MPWPAMRENQAKLGTPKSLALVLCAAHAALPLAPLLLTLLALERLIITCSKVCIYVCFFSFLRMPTHISFGKMTREWKKGKAMHILKQHSLHERKNEREQDTYITQMRGLSLLGPGVVCPGSLFLGTLLEMSTNGNWIRLVLECSLRWQTLRPQRCLNDKCSFVF